MTLFTPEDLLEYHYRETSSEKTDAIAAALESNWALHQKYEVICEATEQLDKSIVSPRKKAVQSILDYAAHAATASV
jgi:hypothetical protein